MPNEGKYRVLGVDTYDKIDWVEAELDSRDEALTYVIKKTAEVEMRPNLRGFKWDYNKGRMIPYSESTLRYYAYTPEGSYIDANIK